MRIGSIGTFGKKKKRYTLKSFKPPKWTMGLNETLHLKCCLILENETRRTITRLAEQLKITYLIFRTSHLPSKDLQHGSIQRVEVSKLREAPSTLDDKGCDLSIPRLIGPRPIWAWPIGGSTCTAYCYCLIYFKPFRMSWLRFHLCSR